MPRNKFNARKVHEGEYTFDSLAEARRWRELCLLQKAGEITDLVVHPRWELFPKDEKLKLRAIHYTADFMYDDYGTVFVEDVKGVITRDAAIRMNIFQRQHPEIEFRIIK